MKNIFLISLIVLTSLSTLSEEYICSTTNIDSDTTPTIYKRTNNGFDVTTGLGMRKHKILEEGEHFIILTKTTEKVIKNHLLITFIDKTDLKVETYLLFYGDYDDGTPDKKICIVR